MALPNRPVLYEEGSYPTGRGGEASWMWRGDRRNKSFGPTSYVDSWGGDLAHAKPEATSSVDPAVPHRLWEGLSRVILESTRLDWDQEFLCVPEVRHRWEQLRPSLGAHQGKHKTEGLAPRPDSRGLQHLHQGEGLKFLVETSSLTHTDQRLI